MRTLHGLATLAAMLLIPALAPAAGNPFAGRWDLTVHADEAYPSWLGVQEKDGKLEVMVQPRSGHVRPAADAQMEGSRLMVTVMRGNNRYPTMTWELTADGDNLTGTQTQGDESVKITGERAPELDRPMPSAWSDPKPIFNGKDLSGWEPIGGHGESFWLAKDGLLLNEKGGANLKTTKEFQDFKLHVEFQCPGEGNSGIYLRGRYEIQLTCGSHAGGNPVQALGAVYGRIAPSEPVTAEAGEWQTYDITLVGRTVTVTLNGKTIVDNKEIEGITGGALDSQEAEPGPFYIQGDHTGGIAFRNITVALPKT